VRASRLLAICLAVSVLVGSVSFTSAAWALQRIGVLDVGGTAAREEGLGAFRHALRELGHVEGRDVVIEYRSVDGRAERLPDLAGELVRLNVDVIVTWSTPAALAARHVTDTVPIVMASGSAPVFAGLVRSLARPGGNVTGLHDGAPPELAGRRLRFLAELVPGLARVGVLLDSGDVYGGLVMPEIERSARALGVRIHRMEARRPEDFEQRFETALADGVDALIAVEGPMTTAAMTQIVQFATMSRLPAISGSREFVEAGGLMAYGPDPRDLSRRAAAYVHRILGGARPADLPVEAPARFELAINLKAARALGLAIPPSVLQQAEYVIR
jgi:putative ABC transport system substrate-binding protein